MQFRFQPRRAAQAAGVLVRLAGGRLNYTKLIKLLHLADRQSLFDVGAPITGDSVVNMPNGPVLSRVYDCIRANENQFAALQCETWMACFRTEEYDLVGIGDPGDSELSDYDVELLEGLHRKYREYSFRDMINVAHDLPEWNDPTPARSERLTHDQILEANGASPETVSLYNEANASVRQFDSYRVIRN